MKTEILLFIVFWLLSTCLFSQKNDSSVISKKLENYIRLSYDNDFFEATDQYYTQGIQLAIIHPIIKYFPLSYALIRLNKNAAKYYGLQFEQDCFTPRSIRYDSIPFGERPYAATFFVSHSLTSVISSKKILLQTQLDLGVIGPCARCEDEQKAIHRSLLNIQPLGWEYQIQTDYIINYRTKFEKGIITTKNIELMGNASARLGTLYTDLGFGLHSRIGFFNPYFKNLGLEKNGTSNKFKLYGIFKFNTKFVAYNATMQGGLFNTESVLTIPEKNITRVVFDGLAGVIVAYKRVSFEYSKTFLTPEFSGGLYHGWGRVAITVCY